MKIPNINIKKTLLKLRNVGISSKKVFEDLGITGAWAYTGSPECDPAFKRGILIWNYANDRLTDDELLECIDG